ncbi:hypothetical protein R2R70_02445 [Cobetia sp. SIMBA_158]|uniref:hypothetical protein n=1 Tax=Cobetia sp. SIMBA_158 TaxID=3081617 RepID=UPI00397FDDFE
MNYTYLIDNYNTVDDLLGVVYTPDDESLSPTFLRVRPGDTAEETIRNIKAMAPVEVWELELERIQSRNEQVAALIGTAGQGEKVETEAGRAEITEVNRLSRTLEEAKASALSRINRGYQEAMNQILSSYPIEETITFDKQEREARAWIESSSLNRPETPYLDALLSTRPMDKGELVSRVIAKADAFVALSGAMTGKRQAYEDQIELVTTLDEADAIVWEHEAVNNG